MLVNLIKNFPKSHISCFEDMSKHSTMRVGGVAKYYVRPADVLDIMCGISFLQTNKCPFRILGLGANTIFAKDVYPGVVVDMRSLNSVYVSGGSVYAEAGATLKRVFSVALARGLGGIAPLAAIPSTVGGAIIMNAGAYGKTVSDNLSRVGILREGKFIMLSRENLKFSYRKCEGIKPADVVVFAEFKLGVSSEAAEIAEFKDCARKKRRSQPLELPSCGSVFKNAQDIPSSKLIDMCGLKGKAVGGAMVSDKHAGFIVNFNRANYDDVLKLIDYIKKEVYNKYKVKLETEIVIV